MQYFVRTSPRSAFDFDIQATLMWHTYIYQVYVYCIYMFFFILQCIIVPNIVSRLFNIFVLFFIPLYKFIIFSFLIKLELIYTHPRALQESAQCWW